MTAAGTTTFQVLQDRLAELLGCGVELRTSIVAGMLRRNAAEATSYWFQLVVSIGIATFGLVLGSTAAVIGAMLVAPLMGPIVGLAMGLATGSPFLVLRSAGRVGLSVVIVVAGAAGITLLLPFHELNAEIASRTTPTALDLLTAAFCALAGVYATLRPGSDTTVTAAGTSISISLVPPLCASGYGVGTSSGSVAAGAALLFLTNLVAIVVVGTVSFLAAGFNRVGVRSLEHDELARSGDAPVSRAIARRLDKVFGSRSGAWLRLLMPFVLLAAVYIPLRRALNEVAWEVLVRATVQKSIAGLKQPIVQSRVRVERHRVDVAVVLLGKSSDADAARGQLEQDIRSVAGVPPRLEVLAIPDSAAFAGLESTLRAPAAAPIPTTTPAEALRKSREFVTAAVEKYFPVDTAGAVLQVDIGASGTPIIVDIIHHGRDLPRPAVEVLERSLSAEIDHVVRVSTSAIPSDSLVRDDDDFRFIAEVSSAMEIAGRVQAIAVCATRPREAASWLPGAARDKAFAAAMLGLLSPGAKATIETGKDWSVRFTRGTCGPAPTDGGVNDAQRPPGDSGEEAATLANQDAGTSAD